MTLWPLSSWLLDCLLNKAQDPFFYLEPRTYSLSQCLTETDKKMERARNSQNRWGERAGRWGKSKREGGVGKRASGREGGRRDPGNSGGFRKVFLSHPTPFRRWVAYLSASPHFYHVFQSHQKSQLSEKWCFHLHSNEQKIFLGGKRNQSRPTPSRYSSTPIFL